MTGHSVLLLLLLGHFAGDFYTQSDKMAQGKLSGDTQERREALALHGLLYAICMAVTLFGGVEWSWNLLWLFLAVCVTHMITDCVKRFIKKKPFILDQCIHGAFLFSAWCIWGGSVTVRAFVPDFTLPFLPQSPLWTLLGLMIILRPAGYLIESDEIWNFSNIAPSEPQIDANRTSKSQKDASRMIGYLERLIVYFLLISNQYASIGFVIAAKAVIRFPEIDQKNPAVKRGQAEYFLIGTLLSMVSVFTVALLLRLISA